MKRKLLSSMLAAAVVVTSTFSTTSVSEAKEPDASNGKVEVTMKDNSVTIGNDAIERTFSTADSKLSTTEIVNKRTDGGETNFTPEEGSEEFIVKTTKEKKDPISLEPIDRKGWTAEADSYLFINSLVANIGVKVNAAKEEMITEPDTTILNSRNRRPVVPSINTIGKNTATSVMVVEITAKKISLAPSIPASFGGIPFSIRT